MWWSNRGDGSDMRLTRTVDLRGVDHATLQYSTWYDIEDGFDYAYVEASEDGGATWKTLRASASTDKDPNGTNLGNGITGKSGGGSAPKWVSDRVDLSAFARKQIQLRFEYVTDQALNKDGFAIDDIGIPEIGWSDDAEADRDWTAAGFVRSSNAVRERFVAQVLSFGAAPSVTRATTGADGTLHLDATVGDAGGLLAVTAFAAATTQPGSFELRVTKP
jgi:bacillopeptidase F (M6 metalloprotease family)